MRLATFIALVLVTAPAAAQTPDDPPPAAEPTVISGLAEIVDGDTLKISGARIRLFGIDAPEMQEWPWGPRARSALEDLTDGRTVTCLQRDTDRYDRPVATCATADTPDLAEALIAAGHAITYRRFTARTELHAPYMAAERDARDAGLGPSGAGHAQAADGFLRTYQSGLGALLGLFVLSGVAWYNARKARERDDRIRELDAQALAAELGAEIAQVRHELETAATFLRAEVLTAELTGKPVDTDKHGRMTRRFPSFDANCGRLGLLEPSTVVRVVKFVRNILSFPDLADCIEHSPDFMIEKWSEICLSAAHHADAIARELAGIAGLDESELDEFPMFEGSFVKTTPPADVDEDNRDHGDRQSGNARSSE